MEEKTLSVAEKATKFEIGYPMPWCGVGVRAEHWPLIKDLTRLVLPEIQPARRLEVLARAFGYRTAASLQAAISAATDADLFLAPERGKLDEFRAQALLQAIGADLDQDGCDRFVDAASLVCAGLLMTHLSGKAPKTIEEIENFQDAQPFWVVAPGRTQTSLGKSGPIDLKKFLPDLRECTIGSWRFSQDALTLQPRIYDQGEPWVEIVDTSRGSPSAEDIRKIGGKGNVRVSTFAGAYHYLDEPEYAADEMAVTLLARCGDGTPRGFMTVRLKIGPQAAEDHTIADYVYVDPNHAITDEDVLSFGMAHWDLNILFQGFGLSKGEDEDDVLNMLAWVVRGLLQFIGCHVRNCANRSGEIVTTRVAPDEGEDFGFLTFDTMIQWIEETIEDIDDGYDPEEGVPMDHEFEYVEP